MDPINLIVSALVLGASAGLKPTAENLIKDAYAGLKTLIQRKYADVSVSVLEKNPASGLRQEVLSQDLAKADVGEDEEVLSKAIELLEAVLNRDPEVARSLGVGLEDIKAASLRIQGVSTTGETTSGVKIKKAVIDGDIEISNVSAKSTTVKPPKSGSRRTTKKKSGKAHSADSRKITLKK